MDLEKISIPFAGTSLDMDVMICGMVRYVMG